MEKRLYKFFADCGRMGSLEGVFTATQEELKEAIGKEVMFYEVSGKHSEIWFDLEEDHFEEITSNPSFIRKVEEYDLTTGINPLNYINEVEDE